MSMQLLEVGILDMAQIVVSNYDKYLCTFDEFFNKDLLLLIF